MSYKNFDEMIAEVQKSARVKNLAVAAAEDKHTLEAVLTAQKDKLIRPVLVGDAEIIERYLRDLNYGNDDIAIFDIKDRTKAAQKAAELVGAGTCDILMKGSIETADLMKVVLKKENGLRTDSILSHIAFFELSSYHKILACTDTGMVTYPDLEEKKLIIKNAVKTLNKMGIGNPKTALLAAVEKVNPKMPETVDAGELKKLYGAGYFENCLIEGPISYDLAMHRESAQIKGYESPVAGDADLLVVPDMTAGNIMGKALVFSAGAKMCGFIVGAKAPVILTSRASSTQDKYLSIILSALAA
jgi:phosphate butyryltransferase